MYLFLQEIISEMDIPNNNLPNAEESTSSVNPATSSRPPAVKKRKGPVGGIRMYRYYYFNIITFDYSKMKQ